MKLRNFVLAVSVALVLAGAALAAAPMKGGLYSGTLTGRGLEKKITLKVAPNGKTATAALYCAKSLYTRLKRFPIKKGGTFDTSKRAGSILVVRLRGRFVSRKSAAVGLIPRAACDGVGGSFRLYLAN
jgi:hypothetical protein